VFKKRGSWIKIFKERFVALLGQHVLMSIKDAGKSVGTEGTSVRQVAFGEGSLTDLKKVPSKTTRK